MMTDYLPILLTNWNLALHHVRNLLWCSRCYAGIKRPPNSSWRRRYVTRHCKALGATLESVSQRASSIIKAIGAAIHDTLNGVGDLHEKVVGSLGEAASKVIESTGHAVKDSTTSIGNMFHGILSGIRGTIQWRLILAIILVLLYINLSTPYLETTTLESRIIGGVEIIRGLDIVIIINNRVGWNNRGVGRVWKNSCPQLKK